jgi:hypothetical protein
VNRLLLYLVLGVAGLAVTFWVLLYVSFQIAKLLVVGVLLLAAVLVGKRLLARNGQGAPRLSHDNVTPLPQRSRERRHLHRR